MPSVRCRPSDDTSSPNVIACSHIERTTDLGDSWWSATQGWPWAYVSYAASSSSASGLGWVTSWSSSIRSSYSMPSAFIAATASPRARNSCALSTCRGSSRVDSTTDTTSSA